MAPRVRTTRPDQHQERPLGRALQARPHRRGRPLERSRRVAVRQQAREGSAPPVPQRPPTLSRSRCAMRAGRTVTEHCLHSLPR
ncbi:hypothetical protein ACFPRL_29665 [Pseudoclavibacter helvolus]